ncbi:MAG: hypothetical protein WKG07_39635 [Hymenobacter sp.]
MAGRRSRYFSSKRKIGKNILEERLTMDIVMLSLSKHLYRFIRTVQ